MAIPVLFSLHVRSCRAEIRSNMSDLYIGRAIVPFNLRKTSGGESRFVLLFVAKLEDAPPPAASWPDLEKPILGRTRNALTFLLFNIFS